MPYLTEIGSCFEDRLFECKGRMLLYVATHESNQTTLCAALNVGKVYTCIHTKYNVSTVSESSSH